MTSIEQLPTPCLVVEERLLQANLDRMASQLSALGVPLRPHFKTCKNIDMLRRSLEGQPGGVTVSTLAEADACARAGINDILYAVGIAPGKLPAVCERVRAGISLKIVLDHPDTATAVAQYARREDLALDVLLEIDADGERAGLPPGHPDLLKAAAILAEGGCRVTGVMVHAGGSYRCRDIDCLKRVAEQERVAATTAAARLGAQGHSISVVSVGSTPTALFAQGLEGVTEVRAGVYMFQDLVMAGLGVCRVEDIALSVLAEVIGHRRGRGEVVIDAGWTALSRDRGTADQPLDQGYGMVCDLEGRPVDNVIVRSTNQEHGIVTGRDGAPLEPVDWPIGRRLRILPNHACATAACHAGYHLIRTADSSAQWLPRCQPQLLAGNRVEPGQAQGVMP